MKRKAEIVVVDDDLYSFKFFKNLLPETEYKIYSFAKGYEALEFMKNSTCDLILLDLRLPDISGLDVLQKIRQFENPPEVIMITGFSTVESAVQAMKLGAFDYVQKPFENIDEIKLLIEKALDKKFIRDENLFLKQQIRDISLTNKIITNHPSMHAVLHTVKKVAPLDSTVLITGESGTGKELIARLIHEMSPRAKNRFLTVNCAALSENLLESTLFGHEKGAFTGAVRLHRGYFEVANNGSIFLDEIGEISLMFQVKLLRVLEEKKFQRVGGTEDIHSDVRIIAATNRDLQKEVEKGNFREDLYYRINVVTINLPPLRERGDDILLLIHYFLQFFSEKYNKKIKSISPEAKELLLKYPWPGNVRELKNVIERAVILEESPEITPKSLPESLQIKSTPERSFRFDLPYHEAKQQFEREYIISLLKKCSGNIKRAAEISKIPRQNFYLKIKKYNLDLENFRLN
ncbi:MAG: sigma-54-dependent Fis family transcriptional regulator [Calditrichaeota bacterium]|nr:MAG: sigma-54-dependent Fis family transcriptional regulator [Calditrichota bacterium]